jgi:peptidoglycan/xylan/chitin deacetylase (PgdA/CDA1 family)
VTSRDPRLAILSYHKIGPPPEGGWATWFYVPEATFAGHLAYLRDSGWTVIDLATLVAGLDEAERLPERAAVLTFDDGYRSLIDVALPWLRHFGYPGVVFVPTAFIGGRNAFDDGVEPAEAICGWEELAELERNGLRVQSHGVTHRPFSELDPAGRADELRQSKTALEIRLGSAVTLFAYPFGVTGPDEKEADAALQRAGYRGACLYGGEPVRGRPIPDRYRLPRVAMGFDTDLTSALG